MIRLENFISSQVINEVINDQKHNLKIYIYTKRKT